MPAPAYGTEITIPVYDGTPGTFVYCYTAETTIHVGACVQVGYDTYTSTLGYYNPMASIPDNTGSIYHKFGIATKTLAAAGGLWVQTKGRCFFTKVEGNSDVTVGSFLKPVTAKLWLVQDHATVKTVEGVAIFEGCRHGAAGTTAWGITAASIAADGIEFEPLSTYPFYVINETLAYSAQGYVTDTIGCDPAGVIYLTGVPAVF
jgi:hypothetical protein